MNDQGIVEGPITVVVIAGAVARGAYEAAVLAELLPRFLTNAELRNTVFIGTSAGAINAALWARFSHLGVAAAGQAVMNVWSGLEDKDIFRALLPTAFRDAWGLLTGFVTGAGLSSVLNAAPLRETVTRELHAEDIERNLRDRRLRGVGVVATACGAVVAGARSHAFVQFPEGALTFPELPRNTSIDYYAENLGVEHILASSAVPALFQPIAIPVPGDSTRLQQLYIDGGLRLNTPIKPAIDLGARRVIIVSSHSAHYPKNSASPAFIGIDDAVALLLHSMLADGMIEDLNQLRRINALVRAAKAGGVTPPVNKRDRQYRSIPYLVVAPDPGMLANEARKALGHRFCSLHLARYQFLDAALRFVGAGAGRDELLSYLFFDKTYTQAQFALGKSDASQVRRWRR